ncbi:50S ribosomal protein L23 [Candidatus Cyrtobacter comes]|uniref:Large ribosomal subunit protein uL23 n=1 Tax=Candidatus Cyrtobacter comes TaxID=675776 RepID=A0ABU5L7D9_9RICK|nr:50S ribosomal protein L23 [Candidatus Cyrtobacter comes]MDZ5761724.1 50S ribosomal protein L23 [Candidatus Cyrtobacter comes]
MKFYQDIIQRPVVTEKAAKGVDLFLKYSFFVHQSSDKQMIKVAIEKFFDVKVKKINIINGVPKPRNFKGVRGKSKSNKKAIVTLEKGFSIDAFK